MSKDNQVVDISSSCASCCAYCGIAETDDIKLKDCDGCDLVKYCSDDCKRDHKPKHEEDCKKRAAELRDELLFKQPESTHLGDCPICSLPLPLDTSKLMPCCSKTICNGCFCANVRRELEGNLKTTCPFCRKPTPKTDEEANRLKMKRIEANDPVALCQWGLKHYKQEDYGTAYEYLTKAAELGDVEAHHILAILYHKGDGVEKDVGKEIYHLEEATIGGHPFARYNLARYEWKIGNIDRAVKHYIIAATLGDVRSTKTLMTLFQRGFVSKEELAAALRAHQAAVDATKSPQREAAE